MMIAAEAPASPPTRDELARIVCVVDDDVSLLRALQRLLGAGGFRVKTFASAEDFLASAYPATTGCLVLDVHLGGLSGFELHERLVSAGWPIPVVFITARDDSATRERARCAGAVDYLRKPFDDESLIAGVNRALGHGRPPAWDQRRMPAAPTSDSGPWPRSLPSAASEEP
ncbi:MAG: response regulator transcription factor [Candidatus Rokuibacteriota bacterium]